MASSRQYIVVLQDVDRPASVSHIPRFAWWFVPIAGWVHEGKLAK
jgi:hypothetical protein